MDYSDYIRFNADVIALPSGRRPNRDRGDYASDAKMGRPGRDPRGASRWVFAPVPAAPPAQGLGGRGLCFVRGGDRLPSVLRDELVLCK